MWWYDCYVLITETVSVVGINEKCEKKQLKVLTGVLRYEVKGESRVATGSNIVPKV